MSAYSNLFASGLLAPNHGLSGLTTPTRAYTPAPPSSPMILPTTPGDPIDRTLNLTPTPNGAFSSNTMLISPGPLSSNAANGTESHQQQRPRLRKRRSSLSVTANPMGNIKSPGRNAGSALQRTGFMSPSRHRGGSIIEHEIDICLGAGNNRNVASEETSLTGRMGIRNVGVGRIFRSRRNIRKAGPSGPAPTAPLPAVPTTSQNQITFPIPQQSALVIAPKPRPPLVHRLHTVENRHSPLHPHPHAHNANTTTSPISPNGTSNQDFTSKLVMAISVSPPPPIGAQQINPVGMDVELGAAFQYQYQQGHRECVDEDMKEN